MSNTFVWVDIPVVDLDRAIAFYSAVTGIPVTREDADGWVVLGDATDLTHPHIAFQPAPDHVPPQWPDPAHPQQMHLDVQVDDIEVAMAEGFDAAFLAVGAHIAKRAYIPAGGAAKILDAVTLLRSMEGEAPPLLGDVGQLAEAVSELHPADIELEPISEPRVILQDPRECGLGSRIAGEKCRHR